MSATILLVEDEEILRSLLVEALSLLDIETAECMNADAAIPLLEGPNAFAFVITDISMPGTMDGLDLAKTIWARWPHLPVILSSGNRVVSHDQLPTNASFLRKPWTLDQLHQAVSKHLPK
ncbi:response regulator [Pseudomonas abietaniphila]|uniref:response regulator n=1 Tax=Pseudomonas abietaniphila TaxID=89065 RepID=UPI0007814755|nr:response regulator [Pseudomonas abietaniphila]